MVSVRGSPFTWTAPSSLSLPNLQSPTLLSSRTLPSNNNSNNNCQALLDLRQDTTPMTTMASSADCSSQPIASAALSYLDNFNERSAQTVELQDSFLGHLTPPESDGEALKIAAHLTVPSIDVTTPANTNGDLIAGHNTTSSIVQQLYDAAASPGLPSLLRYVDNNLMRNYALHNHPPHPIPLCSICAGVGSMPVIPTEKGNAASSSTFLPLSPCGHWVHYRCFIWLATMNDGRRNKCCVCDTRLFGWDGINALTLAKRTGLKLDDNTRPSFQHNKFGAFKLIDRMAYEAECATIDSVIHNQFFAHLARPSKHADGSPDLVQCFYDVLEMLSAMEKPKARWLQYTTSTGYLLWGMLVTIKMRRYLAEGHTRIQMTQGWKEFEDGGKALQERIWTDVHGV
jgi:hypothetical protein